jgi:hypothetical protein
MDYDALTKEDLKKIACFDDIDDRDVAQIKQFMKNLNAKISSRFLGQPVSAEMAPEITLMTFQELALFNQSLL